MIILKFGGASVKDAEAVRNMGKILQSYAEDSVFIVVSAMGKTTNSLEQLADDHYAGDINSCMLRYDELFQYHAGIVEQINGKESRHFADLEALFHMLRSRIEEAPKSDYDQNYDQIVSFGELFSSRIISNYLIDQGLGVQWIDSSSLIKTNRCWRDARVDWNSTVSLIKDRYQVGSGHSGGRFMGLTQGFTGSGPDGEPTTLGREGSDFTAAILAFALDAKEVIIWKDVPGLMNADPKQFPDAVKLDTISFHEAIELSYFGAKVIHPKTIKPLQNKKIPLRIKSFLDPVSEGSLIQSLDTYDQLIPSYILKENQLLLSISAKDFSFIAEENVSQIFSLLAKFGVRANMMQNSAISFSVCIDNRSRRSKKLINALRDHFYVLYNDGLELYTIRHFNEEAIELLLRGKDIILEQRSRTTVQFVVK